MPTVLIAVVALTLPPDTLPLAVTEPAVTVPVVLMVFEPNALNRVTTLALPYVPAIPVNCEPLPKK